MMIDQINFLLFLFPNYIFASVDSKFPVKFGILKKWGIEDWNLPREGMQKVEIWTIP